MSQNHNLLKLIARPSILAWQKKKKHNIQISRLYFNDAYRMHMMMCPNNNDSILCFLTVRQNNTAINSIRILFTANLSLTLSYIRILSQSFFLLKCEMNWFQLNLIEMRYTLLWHTWIIINFYSNFQNSWWYMTLLMGIFKKNRFNIIDS